VVSDNDREPDQVVGRNLALQPQYYDAESMGHFSTQTRDSLNYGTYQSVFNW
jgi:hypothetical protein